MKSKKEENIEKTHTLYLTNLRTNQQLSKADELRRKESLKQNRLMMVGKPFKVKAYKPPYCKSHRIGLLEFKGDRLSSIKFSPILCKSWTCPECSLKKAIKTKYLLKDVIILNKLDYSLTLTLDPKKLPPNIKTDKCNYTHTYITKIYNHFLTVLRRKKFSYYDKSKRKWESFSYKSSKEKLKYVWVIEFQGNGNAHMHILLNRFIPIEVIREVWTQVGGGVMMKIERVKSVLGYSMYLTDYIVKGLKDTKGSGGFNYYERRYCISKSCIRQEPTYEALGKSEEEEDQKLKDLDITWVKNYLYDDSFEELVLPIPKKAP